MREDGAYVEAGENDNLIVQKLDTNPAALGVFGFSFLDQNRDKIQGSAIAGIKPEFESIADGSYPISRPLYFYVKKAARRHRARASRNTWPSSPAKRPGATKVICLIAA